MLFLRLKKRREVPQASSDEEIIFFVDEDGKLKTADHRGAQSDVVPSPTPAKWNQVILHPTGVPANTLWGMSFQDNHAPDGPLHAISGGHETVIEDGLYTFSGWLQPQSRHATAIWSWILHFGSDDLLSQVQDTMSLNVPSGVLPSRSFSITRPMNAGDKVYFRVYTDFVGGMDLVGTMDIVKHS